MKSTSLLSVICVFRRVILTSTLFLACVSAQAAVPLHYDWTGTFEDGTGPFNNRNFSITFTIPDPADTDLAVRYTVDASLTIDEIGTFEQTVIVDFGFPSTTMGISGLGFQNILVAGDSMYFGICTGGSCNDPILWNGDPSNPVLFTGTFTLGLDSSCSVSAPCSNAIANWFDGMGGVSTTNYQGTLVVSSGGSEIVAIDIKPYEQINNINPRSRGLLPVAVLTSGDFDALLVDPATVRFGPANAIDTHGRAHVKDIDNDGDMDLVFHFETRETGISCGDTEATLTGQTWDGTLFSGTDSVNTIGCKADKLTYTYLGNNFEEVDGLIFTTNDRVTAQFTIDCAVAHSAGNCANLPYDNYLQLGAVELEPLSFLAGPAGLPTSDGEVEIAQFSFSTDSIGRIVDWDMDLFLYDPSGVINVDTDNRIGGPIDSAAALGGIAVVRDNPGEWIVEKAISRKVMDKIKGIQKKDKKNKN
jgi:hypothetical protein